MKHGENELQQTLAAARAGAAPRREDRLRMDERLRARLGPAVVDGAAASVAGLGPEPAPVLVGRPSRLGAILSSGLVMGALGLLVGYQLGLRATPEPAPSTRPVATSKALSPMPLDVSSTDVAAPAVASAGAPSMARAEPLPPPAKKSAPRAGTARAPRPASDAASDLGFAEVVARLRRANLALREGRPSLALLQLAELERRAPDTLREEREVTRVLALCAAGDSAGARRRLSQLGATAGVSIYAQRLKQSCVGVQR